MKEAEEEECGREEGVGCGGAFPSANRKEHRSPPPTAERTAIDPGPFTHDGVLVTERPTLFPSMVVERRRGDATACGITNMYTQHGGK